MVAKYHACINPLSFLYIDTFCVLLDYALKTEHSHHNSSLIHYNFRLLHYFA